MSGRMAAIGTKRTFVFAPHMSAFGGKADMVLDEFYEHTPKSLGVSTKREDICILVSIQRSSNSSCDSF
jgi:hypothetical protein